MSLHVLGLGLDPGPSVYVTPPFFAAVALHDASVTLLATPQAGSSPPTMARWSVVGLPRLCRLHRGRGYGLVPDARRPPKLELVS